MQIVSYGEEFPADPGHNETAWAKNRRDEFKVLY
jgi:peptidoglycan-associated lipoprotein